MTNVDKTMVSVIVPSLNNENTLELCLKSVVAQSYKNIEIIVVDNFSTDRTLAIARKYTSRIYSFGNERSKQRNFGIKNARGGYVLYLDSDMVLDRKVVSECLLKINNHVALYIPEIVEGNNFFTKILNFERSFYNQTPVDAVRFVRKDALIKIKGFDESLVACEDWDLEKRLSQIGKFDIISSPLYHLQYDLTLFKYLKKKSYYGQFVSRYLKKWGNHDEIVKKQFGFKYRFFQVFAENGKWRKLLKNPAYALFMYFLKIVFAFIFIFKKNIR